MKSRIREFLGDKGYFLVSNILKGFFYLGILLVLYLLLQKYSSEEDRHSWFGGIYDRPLLVMVVFVFSELLFGIIPPEVFMLWSLKTRLLGPYFLSVGYLAIISYGAGFLNFNLGRWLSGKEFIHKSRFPWVKKYLRLFKKYGAYLLVVAAVSPLPFSAVALLCGMGKLRLKKYLVYTLLRIVRFFVYASFIYAM